MCDRYVQNAYTCSRGVCLAKEMIPHQQQAPSVFVYMLMVHNSKYDAID